MIRRGLLVAVVGVVTLSGCDLVRDYLEPSLEEQLRSAAVESWASPGRPFYGGTFGSDTVGAVEEQPDGEYQIVLPDAEERWTLEIRRADVLPVVEGDAFLNWLNERIRSSALRTYLPREAAEAVRSGRVLAVGDLEVRFGRAGAGGTTTEERVAYLEARQGADPVWVIQREARSNIILRDALKTVYREMTFSDDRVLTCMGAASPNDVPRTVQLDCVREVIEAEFGDGTL